MKDTYRGFWRGDKGDRSSTLTPVAPSGRKPRPIETESVSEAWIEEKPQEVQFCFPVDYIPAGKRNWFRSWVRDRTFVQFAPAARSEAETACRIRWRGAKEDTEIVSCNRRLWWSLPGQPTVGRFLAALASGEPAAWPNLNL
jgi:hypothetical protein